VVHNAKVDRDYQGTYAVLLTQVSRGDITQADTCQFDWNSNKQRSKIAHFLTTLDHPSILNTVEVGFGLDSQNMFVQRWVSEEGSLRDALYEKGPFDSVFAKYPRSHLAAIEKGRPLRPGMIRQYGREILEGLLYFESVGLPYYNLHSGNVILVKGHVKLTDYENAFLGFKTRVHDSIKKLRSVDPQMAAFGAVLYEMCTGKQIPTAMNSKISLKVTAAYRDFQGLLDDIFTDPSLTFSQLSNHALFAAVTVKQPPIGNPASIAKKTKVKKLLRKASKHFVKDVYAGNKAKKRAKKVRKKSAIESKRQAEFDNDDYSSSSGDSFNEKSSSDDGGGLSEDSGDDSW
jgi:hypothetical protein